MISHFRARPRLITSAMVGAIASVLLPGEHSAVTRGLLGWNIAVWLYLVLVIVMMLRADHDRLRRVALAQAEAASTVLTVVILAAIASLIGIIVELSAAKVPGAPHALPHVLFALATVLSAWLLIPTMFALTYASAYYHAPHGATGLEFPDHSPEFRPDYVDFLYFSFTLAVASQTADISITSSAMRRLVLVQSLLSFFFNAAILAFSINIAASMF